MYLKSSVKKAKTELEPHRPPPLISDMTGNKFIYTTYYTNMLKV